MSKAKKQMISMDIIRIFACFSVMAVHIANAFNIPGRVGQFMQAGSSGLGIFYILSGFLGFFSLDYNKGSIGKWYSKRFIRILPIYYFVLVVYVCIFGLGLQKVPEWFGGLGWTTYFLCLNTIFPKFDSYWYSFGALSSMSVFIWFYILAPIIKKIIDSYSKSIIFILITFGISKVLSSTQWLGAFKVFYYFAIGICAYYAVKEGKEIITTVVFCSVMALLTLAGSQSGIIYALIFGTLITNSTQLSIENIYINRVIGFLSERTFAIYLGHATIYQLMPQLGIEKNIKGFVLFVVYSLVAIFIIHEVVEKYTMKLYNVLVKKMERV